MKLRVLAGLVLSGVLLAGATAFAARGLKKTSPHWNVTAHYWEVSINGRDQKVPASGTASDSVESITPEVALSTGREGEYSYTYKLVGPRRAGITGTTERTFEGRTAVVAPSVVAIQFDLLGRHAPNSNVGHFIPGIYRFELFVYKTPGHEVYLDPSSHSKPTLVEDIKLVSQ